MVSRSASSTNSRKAMCVVGAGDVNVDAVCNSTGAGSVAGETGDGAGNAEVIAGVGG